VNRPTDRYLRFPRVGLRRIFGSGSSGCEHAIPPAGGRKLTASDYQSQMVPFAMELASRISLRLEHHNSLTSFETEDIEQELITYVLERASQFDPTKGSVGDRDDGDRALYEKTRDGDRALYKRDRKGFDLTINPLRFG
jgi:hypothetical protein